MNPREELYRSGAGLTVRHAYAKGGRKVPILDPDRRAKAAVASCLIGGLTPRQAARALDMPLARTIALGIAVFRRKS